MSNQADAMMWPSMHLANKLNNSLVLSSPGALVTLKHKEEFSAVSDLFAIDAETFPVQLQMELKEVQCNGTLKAK